MPFEVPTGEQLAARLASVLEVVYLVFNEGYSATAGDDVMRPALDGTPVLLLEQDRSRWDWMLVARGLAALERAERIGTALGP